MVAPQGQAVRVPLAVPPHPPASHQSLPSPHQPLPSPHQPSSHISNTYIPGTSHKRPWEDEAAPYEPQRPQHVSRSTLHFEKHIIHRNEPRDLHPDWVERAPKKHRAKPNAAQVAAYPYYGHRDRVERDRSLSREEERYPRKSWGHEDHYASQSPDLRRHSKPESTKGYVPVMWRQGGEERLRNKYADLPPVGELELEEPENWGNEGAHSAHKDATQQETRGYFDNPAYPVFESQRQAPPQARRVPNGTYRQEQPEGYTYPPEPRPTPTLPEPRRWSATSAYESPSLSSAPPSQPPPYQRPPSPSPYKYPPSPPRTSNSHPDHPHPSAGQTVAEANCATCKRFTHVRRECSAQLERVHDSFSAFGPYQEIHLEYSARGVRHEDIPGFGELHRLVGLIEEASKLGQFVVMSGKVLQEKLYFEKKGEVGRAKCLDTDYQNMRRKLGEEVASTTSPTLQQPPRYPSQSQPTPYPTHATTQQNPTPIPYDEISAPGTSDRRTTAYLEHKALIDHQTDTSSIKRSSNMGSLPISSQHQNVPTFKVQDMNPTNVGMDAKLKKLKDRLEAEISEVDNLTEEKKRLEDRIKELEGMVEEEREKRRSVQELNMKERKQFLGVVEGIVGLGRRQGDESASAKALIKTEKDGEERKEGEGGEGVIAGGEKELRREVERLRKRNRECESALEHIQRESRHMEDTAGKLNESRRGIELVLGRVLAGGPGATGGAVTNPVAIEG